MRFKFLAVLAIVVSSGPALATPEEDTAWIKQCTQDNKDEGAKEEVVMKYCACMNEQMDDNDDASISDWEKAHPEERKTCEKTSGWR